jgi:hypothetical protein
MNQPNKTALWSPGWYELDQSLVLGERHKFLFFQHPPEAYHHLLTDREERFDLVFFNQLDSNENCCVRYARVMEMVHPQLGPLLRVDTDGLDYIFYPVLGEEVVVNAEESPGAVCEGPEQSIQDWSVIVTLGEVSEPVGELA